jgi:nucleoside triphosphatase
MTGQIIPCVGAIIFNEEGKVLLVKHVPEKGGFWAGKYICPGGRLEFGEPLEKGVRREVLEETGLEIQELSWLPPKERIILKSDGTVADHVLYLDVQATIRKGVFRPGSDVGEGQWFSQEELLDIQDEIHEDTKDLLRQVGILLEN